MENNMTEQRPWGTFTVLATSPRHQVKQIVVKAGQRLSYQYHTGRAEHWFVVRGSASVVLEGEALTLEPGQSMDIPAGAKHRLGSASATEEVVFIEVQTGDYLGEDDIVRLEDDYHRISKS